MSVPLERKLRISIFPWLNSGGGELAVSGDIDHGKHWRTKSSIESLQIRRGLDITHMGCSKGDHKTMVSHRFECTLSMNRFEWTLFPEIFKEWVQSLAVTLSAMLSVYMVRLCPYNILMKEWQMWKNLPDVEKLEAEMLENEKHGL